MAGPLLGLAFGIQARGPGVPLEAPAAVTYQLASEAPAAPAAVAPAPVAVEPAPVLAAPAEASESLALSPQSAMVPGSAEALAPIPDLSALAAKGYVLRPVRELQVLNTLAARAPDARLSQQRVGPGGWDAVVNGGFYFADGAGALHPAGAVMRGGELEASGVPKAARRGGVARLEDGTVVIGRQLGATAERIQARFGATSPVSDFMGGGALLIEDGAPVTSADLLAPAERGGQQFDQGGGGIHAQQMRRTHHTVLGVREGQLFLVAAKDRTGAEIQADLVAAGFGAALKLDGGSGSYFREARGAIFANTNPLGFGLRFRE